MGETVYMEVRPACMCALSHLYRTSLAVQALCRCARAVSGLLPKAPPKCQGSEIGWVGWGATRSGAGLMKSLSYLYVKSAIQQAKKLLSHKTSGPIQRTMTPGLSQIVPLNSDIIPQYSWFMPGLSSRNGL
jgi:hypothetical protein